jgi:hypothetical protein
MTMARSVGMTVTTRAGMIMTLRVGPTLLEVRMTGDHDHDNRDWEGSG